MRILAYIDPGTGSMLFTVLIGVLGAAFYFLRNLFVRLRFMAGGGSEKEGPQEERVPYVTFAESKRYWNTFGPICEEFERRGVPLEYLTASPDDPALEKSFEHVRCRFIGEGNRAFAHMNFLKADIVLATTPGLDVYQWKRSPSVKWYVHILHAPSEVVAYRMFGTDYYDALLLSGDFQIRQVRELEKLRGLPAKELRLAGVPYLDAMKKRLEAAKPLPAHPLTVLLAPSWGESAILKRYGKKIIDALLKTGYHIIIRPHPQSFTSEKELMEELMKAYPDSERLEWNRDNDNFEVLRRSDLMISDFSGVIFDYALIFRRPVIYADTRFDYAPYDAAWLDEKLWTFETLPRIGKPLREEDFDGLQKIIGEMTESAVYREGIERAVRESWANIGNGAAYTADYLITKHGELYPEDTAPAGKEAVLES